MNKPIKITEVGPTLGQIGEAFEAGWSAAGGNMEVGAIAEAFYTWQTRRPGIGTCKCGNSASLGLHRCPYQWELFENDAPCDCCANCERECAMDI